MSTAPHTHAEPYIPPMGTLRELRAALSVWGLPGDAQALERELDAVDLDDLGAVREVVQAFRHRVILRQNPEAMAAVMAPAEAVNEELRRKLAGQ
ncbi:hypothetical protein [Kitasatospora sp. NPDC098663]|uniref:hypothetical protein n=1 Tax=Kitasatospora sp. NPDC098663 TaxID=3364096 RepID=UPI0038233D4D